MELDMEEELPYGREVNVKAKVKAWIHSTSMQVTAPALSCIHSLRQVLSLAPHRPHIYNHFGYREVPVLTAGYLTSIECLHGWASTNFLSRRGRASLKMENEMHTLAANEIF